MKVLKVFVFLMVAGVAVVIGVAYSGIINVGATQPHSALLEWLLSTTSRNSIEYHAKSVEAIDLSDETLALAGAKDFDAMCAGCHGAPGKPPNAAGQGLNPQAPDLAVSATKFSVQELFWVTQNGIMMTGMPAWGATHDEKAIWPVVSFMTLLPDMDVATYQGMLARGENLSHHGDGGTHGIEAAPDMKHDHSGAHGTEKVVAPEEAEPTQETGHENHDHDH